MPNDPIDDAIMFRGADRPIEPYEAPADATDARIVGYGTSFFSRPEWTNQAIPLSRRVQDFMATQARAGTPRDQTFESFERHFPGVDPQHVAGLYGTQTRLEEERAALRGQGEHPLTFMLRRSIPVVSAVASFLRTNSYNNAQHRIAEGNPEPDDYAKVAHYEWMQGLEKERGFGMRLLGTAAHVPAWVGEFAIPGAIGARGFGLAARAATPTAEAAVPLLGAAAPSLAARGAGYVGPALARTAAAPSMYLPGWAERNLEAGLPAPSPGMPTGASMANLGRAYAFGALQTALLGTLGKAAEYIPGRGVAPAIARIGASGVLGAAEMRGLEYLAGKTGLQTGFGTIDDFAQGREGEAWQHVAIDALTFAAFSAMHGRTYTGPPLEPFANAVRRLRDRGFREDKARELVQHTHDMFAAAVAEPGFHQRQVLERLAGNLPMGPARDYGMHLARTLPLAQGPPAGIRTPEQQAAQGEFPGTEPRPPEQYGPHRPPPEPFGPPEPYGPPKPPEGGVIVRNPDAPYEGYGGGLGPYGTRKVAAGVEFAVEERMEAEHPNASWEERERLGREEIDRITNGPWAVRVDSRHANMAGTYSRHQTELSAHAAMLKLKDELRYTGLRFSVEHDPATQHPAREVGTTPTPAPTSAAPPAPTAPPAQPAPPPELTRAEADVARRRAEGRGKFANREESYDHALQNNLLTEQEQFLVDAAMNGEGGAQARLAKLRGISQTAAGKIDRAALAKMEALDKENWGGHRSLAQIARLRAEPRGAEGLIREGRQEAVDPRSVEAGGEVPEPTDTGPIIEPPPQELFGLIKKKVQEAGPPPTAEAGTAAPSKNILEWRKQRRREADEAAARIDTAGGTPISPGEVEAADAASDARSYEQAAAAARAQGSEQAAAAIESLGRERAAPGAGAEPGGAPGLGGREPGGAPERPGGRSLEEIRHRKPGESPEQYATRLLREQPDPINQADLREAGVNQRQATAILEGLVDAGVARKIGSFYEAAPERPGFGQPMTGAERRTPGGGQEGPGGPARPQAEIALADAALDAYRVKKGLPPLSDAIRVSNPEGWAHAREAFARDPEAGRKLVDELSRTERGPSKAETALLLHRRVQLENEHNRALVEGNNLYKFDSGATAIDIAAAEARERSLKAEIDRTDKVIDKAGNVAGWTLQFRRQLAREDFSLSSMMVKAEAARKQRLGRELNTAELDALKADVARQSREIEAAQARADAAEQAVRGVGGAKVPGAAELTSSKEYAASGEAGAAVAKLKDRFRSGVEADKEPGGFWNRLEDVLVKTRVAFVISGVKTLAKIAASGATQLVAYPAYEAAGSLLRQIPGIAKIAARAPREGKGFSSEVEAKAIASGWERGFKDAWEVFRTGKSELERAHGGGVASEAEGRGDSPVGWLDLPGVTHGALKAPAVRVEYTRSLLQRLDHAAAQGVDIRDPSALLPIQALAFRDAVAVRFGEANKAVSLYRDAVNKLRQAGGVARVGGFGLKILLPVVRIPTNLVAQTAEIMFGTILGSVRAARALSAGVEKLAPDQADLIMHNLKRGSVGLVLLGIGLMNPDVIGGYYSGKRREDELPVGAIGTAESNIPTWLLHNPAMEVLQVGATIRRALDSTRKDPRTGLREHPDHVTAFYRGMSGLAQEIPFVQETLQTGRMFEERSQGRAFGELAKSLVVPQLFQWVAGAADTDEQGNPIRRRPQGLLEHIETGIPGVRQQVPQQPARGIGSRRRAFR